MITIANKDRMVEILQDLLPFPPNLIIPERVDLSHLVEVLVFYYNLKTEKSYVELDYDLRERAITNVRRIYDEIFANHQHTKGRVVIYPYLPKLDNQILPIDASRLKFFLTTDYFNLTNEHFLIGVGNQDAILVFLDDRLIVNVHRSGTVKISKIHETLKTNINSLRPTLLFSKIFFWDQLVSGTYLVKYHPKYSIEEIASVTPEVGEILGFDPWFKFGKKGPTIAENISWETSQELKKMLENTIEVIIENEPEFNKNIYLRMNLEEPDVNEN